MDKRKTPDRTASGLLGTPSPFNFVTYVTVHNQGRSEKPDPRANSFKFRKVKIETPDVSVLSDFSTVLREY